MYTVNYVVNQCNNHNIKTFMVKLSSETLDKSIMFDNIDEFFDLAKLSNIKQMYIMPVYDDIENYLISDETITDGTIKDGMNSIHLINKPVIESDIISI